MKEFREDSPMEYREMFLMEFQRVPEDISEEISEKNKGGILDGIPGRTFDEKTGKIPLEIKEGTTEGIREEI